MLDATATLPTGIIVGKERIDQTSSGTLQHVNATTGQVQRDFAIAGKPEVDAAVSAARAALPAWRAWPPTQRRDALRRLADLLRASTAEFAAISVLEAGIISTFADQQAPRAAEWADYYAGWADKLTGATVPMAGAFDYTVHEPVGVVALLLSWNGPTGTIGMKVPAALAAGCTTVLKPSELAPFSAIRFGQLCLEAGIPPGVVNVVPGDGRTGDLLVRHPDINKISLTGGPATAVRVQTACAETLTPLLLELGGKSANLVFADADLDVAAQRAADGIIRMSGQSCVAPTRLLVERHVYDQLLDRVLAALSRVRLGNPETRQTTMGPVIAKSAADRIFATIDRARDEHAGNLLLGGDRQDGPLADGYFVPPTVFGAVDPDSDLAQNEVFGPVLSVSAFEDEAEAVRIANSTRFGLAAYIHTGNIGRVLRLAEQLDAGNISVNGGTPVSGPYGTFGGFKRSGFGKEGGIAGVMEYVRTKNVSIARS